MEPIRIRRGFTLIELLVVFAIIAIISIVVLTSQSTFNKTLVLANTAYDIALALRSAESYGLGSRAFGTTVNAGYGLHFESGAPGSFKFFADTSPAASCGTPDCKSGNHTYTNGADALVRNYALGNGITISDFCAYALGSWSCAYALGGGLSSLDIAFERPNPNPFMSTNGSYSQSLTKACLVVSSPHGGAKYVSVAASGQITTDAAACP